MIPNFDDNRVKYVEFIQNNKDIFDTLFTSEFIRSNSNASLNSSRVQEGYRFFRNFNLGDDADVYSLMEELDAFNTDPNQTDINKLVDMFQRFLNIPNVRQSFKQRFNEKLLREINEQRDKMEERKSRRRTIGRTSEIKDELLDIDYVPDFRPHAVKGKLVRNVGEDWTERNRGGKKNKTRKVVLRYLPKRLTQKDKKKVSKMLLKSRRLYKKGIYYTRKQVKSFKSKPSQHVANARKIYKVEKIGATDELAKKTGCSKAALAKIISKGEGAYFSSGSRPNQTGQSWGIARLASSITSGKAAAVDYNILEEGCKPGSKALKLAKSAKKKYGHGQKHVPKVNLA